MRFRGLTQKNSDDELSDIDPHNLDDPGRRNTFGGLDHTWTTDLKLNVMASELKGKGRLTLEKIQMEDCLKEKELFMMTSGVP